MRGRRYTCNLLETGLSWTNQPVLQREMADCFKSKSLNLIGMHLLLAALRRRVVTIAGRREFVANRFAVADWIEIKGSEEAT